MITIPGLQPSRELRADLAPGPVLLGFSRGKDSIAAWLALRASGVEVIPFHLYRIPGIAFEHESLAYFEDVFGTKILNLPHPALYRWLNSYMFQPPERCSIIDAACLPTPTYEEVVDMLRDDHSTGAWYVDGVRACDSIVRRVAMQRHGVRKTKGLKAHVIWDWQVSDVRAAIAAAGVELPPDYEWFGRSFDGLDRRFLEPLSRHAPDDYATVLRWFHLAELEVIWRG